jgi:hypothetical protein
MKKEKPGWFARFSLLAAGLRLQPRRQGGEHRWSRFGRLASPSKFASRSCFEQAGLVYMQTAYQSEIDEILYGIDVSDRN